MESIITRPHQHDLLDGKFCFSASHAIQGVFLTERNINKDMFTQSIVTEIGP